MKLAFSRPTVCEAEQDELFRGFRAAGFEGLQLKGGQYQAFLNHPEGFIQRWGGDRALVSGLIAGGSLDDAGAAGLRRILRFAAAVGSERVIFCHGADRDAVNDDDIRRFAEVLSELGARAQEEGVRLSLHHHFNQPVMRRRDFDTFFDAVQEGAVGLTVDTAHLVKSGVMDIAGVIRDFKDVLDNIHLKDFSGGEFRVLGRGEIDFGPVFAALKDVGYGGWLCADEESGAEMHSGMKECARYLEKQLAVNR